MCTPRKAQPPCGVPFKWEHAPGVPKAFAAAAATPGDQTDASSAAAHPSPPPPPPATATPRRLRHSVYLPLPPAMSRPRQRMRSGEEEDDPFLAAYLECTASGEKAAVRKRKKQRRTGGEKAAGLRAFSCKCDSAVVEGAVIRVRDRKRAAKKEG